MKRPLRRGPARVLAGIVIAGFAAAWAVGQVLDYRELAQGRQEVARMTTKTRTACVGRFLIDFPADAQIELFGTRIDGFSIDASEESPEEFQERLAARRKEIEEKPDRLGGSRNLEVVRDVESVGGAKGNLFIHSRKVDEGTRLNYLQLERYRYEDVSIEAMVHGSGISIDLFGDGFNPNHAENLSRLVSQIVPNPNERIPVEPGFCAHHAYFREPLVADQGEAVTMVARLPAHPDVEFNMILMAGTKPDEQTLLERHAESSRKLPLFVRKQIRYLRKEPRTINGLTGDELARRFLEENDVTMYSFWWEVNGTQDDVMVPHLSLTMITGHSARGPVPSSLSEGTATALWDKVVSSIRLRPAQAAADQHAGPPEVALGTSALAGERCPHSGWWQCSDGGNGIGVLGGQRQYMKEGERVPQALLLPPQGLWQRLRGLQPSYESATPTAWTLTDKRLRSRAPLTLPLASSLPSALSPPASLGSSEGGDARIGALVTTGAACPASGWWRCEDANALDGTRWFAHGNLLPPATFALASKMFGRSAHSAASITRRSTWRLVRLAASAQAADGTGAANTVRGTS